MKNADDIIIDALRHKIRMMDLEVAEQLVGDGAAEVLEELELCGVIQSELLLVGRIPFREPLCSWKPSESKPNVWALEWITKRRTLPVNAVRVYSISGVREVAKINHDLHLARVFAELDDEDRRRWIGEDEYRRLSGRKDRQGKVPDAVLLDSNGVVTKIVESIGSYGGRRIEQCLDHAARLRRAD